MDSYPGDFPFGIMDVVELLHLRIRRRQANSVYVDCPFCGDRRGKMNVNFVKNVWRCNYCDEHGGMLALYARLNNTTKLKVLLHPASPPFRQHARMYTPEPADRGK